MAIQVINVGTVPNDHTGDSFRVGGQKCNANFAELAGVVLLGYISTTISAASTNNFTPGGGFPTGIGRIDITSATVDFTFTGMVAGTDGQPVIIRNQTTKNMTLSYLNGGSSAANQFTGAGTSSVYPPGFVARVRYYALPSPLWSIE